MRTSNIKEILGESLFKNHSGLALKGRLLYLPCDGFLRGFYFEDSSFNKNILALEVFVLPLFVPTELLYFNFGYRIRRKSDEEWWHFDVSNKDNVSIELSDAIRNEGMSYLERVSTPELFLENCSGQTEETSCWIEAKTYTACILSDRADENCSRLNNLINVLKKYNQGKDFEWVLRMIERAIFLKQKYNENIDCGNAQMGKFIEYSKSNLDIK